MTATCEVCRANPASVRDYALRGGRWIEADVCDECARRRRRAPFALLAAGTAVAALLGGAAIAADAIGRRREQGSRDPLPPPIPPSLGGLGRVFGSGTTLAQYSRDLTDAARRGDLDPVIGRDDEVERVVSILARRSKNNPVLIGEPGVGKTAIVEGLAQRIARGNVPQALRDKRVLALSLGPLVAGTKYRGEFESRVKKILDEVKRAGRDIILFIDELHTLVGAGAAEGSLDLSSMIKPELARGELQCIGATTFDEYRKYVESDAALERRFQPVQVDEPTIEQTVAILRGLRPKYAAHHDVTIDDAALEAAAALSARYIADRYLPDKAIDVVDEAAAAAAMHGERKVDVERVAAIVARWTGIPQGAITDAQRAGLLGLEDQLGARVVGQDAAVRAVAEAIRRARAGLKDPRKPVGGFLFIGPSGVGKTELARALAHALFGTDDALVRLDLSEYTESHTISRLIGAPPGYQGHDEPGQLTEPIRRRPYAVVLFDEIEKAHPDVAAILLQILDDGRVTDAKGRTIDFRHAILVLTSNLDREELEATLRPELLDRIDEIVVFAELGRKEIEQIVELQIAALAERMGAHAMRLDLSEGARSFLAERSAAPSGGARYVARAIARHVTTPLSEAILRGRIAGGNTARVDVADGAIVVEAA
ncbi:MAG: ATP-dependent Clp protease ATP-binding subunit [Candidatus Eremiobacteraeota bacterium]|nr:ATP-dependent Clp protease ATP-binding subunit [Candidatus Eremiobacteraeota bacterium]